jgi:hypothetical protein
MNILEHKAAVMRAKQNIDVFKAAIDIWSQMIELEEGCNMGYTGKYLATQWFGGYNEKTFGVSFFVPWMARIDNKKTLWKRVGVVVHTKVCEDCCAKIAVKEDNRCDYCTKNQ